MNLWIIACFLAHAIWMEWKQRPYVWMRFLLERYYGKRVEYRALKRLVVDANDSLFHVLLLFHRGKKHAIIVKKNQMEMELDENELLYAYFHEKRTNERSAICFIRIDNCFLFMLSSSMLCSTRATTAQLRLFKRSLEPPHSWRV
ncbi:Stage IV sporulation protein FB [Anoxybacillus sp. BCO1]|nr:Stage IV sporulation protein FB [Anoxybacillus sp. BCO1]